MELGYLLVISSYRKLQNSYSTCKVTCVLWPAFQGYPPFRLGIQWTGALWGTSLKERQGVSAHCKIVDYLFRISYWPDMSQIVCCISAGSPTWETW